MTKKDETNLKYLPFNIMAFSDYLEYEGLRRKYTKEVILALNIMSYNEYLKTDHWARLKKAVLGRAGRTCSKCGSSHVEVHVHHLTYKNRGNEDINDMICLCDKCHKLIHGIYEIGM